MMGRSRTELQLLQETVEKRRQQLDSLDTQLEREIASRRLEIKVRHFLTFLTSRNYVMAFSHTDFILSSLVFFFFPLVQLRCQVGVLYHTPPYSPVLCASILQTTLVHVMTDVVHPPYSWSSLPAYLSLIFSSSASPYCIHTFTEYVHRGHSSVT